MIYQIREVLVNNVANEIEMMVKLLSESSA
jgi:hypothetical protein